MDAAQIEQEIEKEALEVTSTTAEGEEEDTTLADIEGRRNRFVDVSSQFCFSFAFRWNRRRCWSE